MLRTTLLSFYACPLSSTTEPQCVSKSMFYPFHKEVQNVSVLVYSTARNIVSLGIIQTGLPLKYLSFIKHACCGENVKCASLMSGFCVTAGKSFFLVTETLDFFFLSLFVFFSLSFE